MSSIGNAAASILQRAVTLEKEQKFTESLVCFQEGIQLLMDVLKEADPDKRVYLRDKIDGYMTHAERIKQHVQKLKDAGKFHEQIQIANNSTGHSYGTTFGRFFDDLVVTIKVEDPYIRTFHQCQNFLRFCELAVKKSKNLKKIMLITTPETSANGMTEQVERFHLIGRSLHEFNVVLHHTFSQSLHDRQITLSTGWIIKIGRGLDYFKPPQNKFTIGVYDLDFRPCFETNVDVFHSKDVKMTGDNN